MAVKATAITPTMIIMDMAAQAKFPFPSPWPWPRRILVVMAIYCFTQEVRSGSIVTIDGPMNLMAVSATKDKISIIDRVVRVF
ncbi:MAG: hypothetical protein LWW94_10355 [Candidatus Desulfofervidaceae bacterium]|nr:hypothetical protein [Candidatus Desulfofervidaceae bacterium]